MEKLDVANTHKQWSVIAGPKYDARLHLPSQALLDFAQSQETYISPEAKLRVAAGGILIGILDLLHPHLLSNDEQTQSVLKAMQQEAGKTIMYSSKLTDGQKEEIHTAYTQLHIPEPAAACALRELREKGIDDQVIELAEWGVMVLAIKETDPDFKLPAIHRENMR